jgi:hypothetical protein
MLTRGKTQEEGGEEIAAEEAKVAREGEEGVTMMVVPFRVEEGRIGKVSTREIQLIMVMVLEVERAKKLVSLQNSQEKYTFHQNLLMMTPCSLEVLALVRTLTSMTLCK